MAGWIKIHERLLDWKWASCPETLALWIHILLRANYKDSQWCGFVVRRGSFITSIGDLAKDTGLSTRQVRTSLARLISTKAVTSKTTNKFTMITVCKYDSYQATENSSDKQNDKQATSKTTSKMTSTSTSKTTSRDSMLTDCKCESCEITENSSDKQNDKQNDKQIDKQSDKQIDNKYRNNIYKESISKDIDKKVSELDSIAQKISCKSKQALDLSFVDEKLSAVFQEFLEMRRKIGKPLKTQRGVKGRYDALIKLSGGDTELAMKIANQTLSHEWQDFYRLKEETEPPKQENYSNSNYW